MLDGAHHDARTLPTTICAASYSHGAASDSPVAEERKALLLKEVGRRLMLCNDRRLISRPAKIAASSSQGRQPATSTGHEVVEVDSVPTEESGEKSVAGHNTNNKTEAEVTAAMDAPKHTINI